MPSSRMATLTLLTQRLLPIARYACLACLVAVQVLSLGALDLYSLV
jgi:hypothetical protein